MATRRSPAAPPATVISFPAIESVLHDQIAARAYELFLERGSEHGHDLEDWVRAEREILASAGEVVSA